MFDKSSQSCEEGFCKGIVGEFLVLFRLFLGLFDEVELAGIALDDAVEGASVYAAAWESGFLQGKSDVLVGMLAGRPIRVFFHQSVDDRIDADGLHTLVTTWNAVERLHHLHEIVGLLVRTVLYGTPFTLLIGKFQFGAFVDLLCQLSIMALRT